ncbi:MAG: alpha/beta hydrolase [Gemmatimonadetes bacterium]|nr:alpha/beta hydrolase [Gemmatimonadota bacterium]
MLHDLPIAAAHAALAAALLVLPPTAPRARAQAPAAPLQDSTLDNLRHAADYRTAAPGTIDDIVRVGDGPVDVVLIPGWGFSADVFAGFMKANAHRYRMVALTVPGFGRTAAPPMPPTGTSYAEQTWTRAAEEGIARTIRAEGLRHPVVVGHFLVGTQLALRLALDHPDLVGGVVIVGGEPVRYTPSRRDTTGRTPATMDERVRGVDAYLAPRWFRTVTRATWNARNYAAAQYSRDAATAAALWRRSADVPLPVMVRYLCEYLASDLRTEYSRLTRPVTALLPDFNATVLADSTQSYATPFFLDAWNGATEANPRIRLSVARGSHLFVTIDQPDIVRDAIDRMAAGAP